ncbi:DUF4229 domain-containing protein [Pseudactinotalea sp. Z1732]|uniref:DUF4229 domain-containing protein n=1 Tax=Micrococcales TaxID=85006 RepID=UPI003C7E9DF9
MPLLTYTLLRVALVVGAGALLYVLGVRSWLLVVLAVLIGAGLSYVLLAGPRQAAADDLERRTGGRPTNLEKSLARDGDDEDAQFDPRGQDYASVVEGEEAEADAAPQVAEHTDRGADEHGGAPTGDDTDGPASPRV